jgi:hypothetical protein
VKITETIDAQPFSVRYKIRKGTIGTITSVETRKDGAVTVELPNHPQELFASRPEWDEDLLVPVE